ncbi:hypothetical protein ACS0TY_026352 [Phlomoides rotata]
MTTSTLPLLLLGFLLLATVSARPCKTLFYFSATTTTTYYPHNRNPNNPNSLLTQNPRYVTLIFTSTTTSGPFPNRHQPLNFEPIDRFNEDSRLSSSSDFPLKFHPSVSSSVRDRTRDILSVVGALLFGVGCGALTAAAMYFMWALLSSRTVDLDDDDDDVSSDDDDDVAVAKKKLGYVGDPDRG